MATKEQLIEELSAIKQSRSELIKSIDKTKQEFARAFDWTENRTYYYGNEKEYIVPTWEQIFVKIGKLLRENKND